MDYLVYCQCNLETGSICDGWSAWWLVFVATLRLYPRKWIRLFTVDGDTWIGLEFLKSVVMSFKRPFSGLSLWSVPGAGRPWRQLFRSSHFFVRFLYHPILKRFKTLQMVLLFMFINCAIFRAEFSSSEKFTMICFCSDVNSFPCGAMLDTDVVTKVNWA